MSYDDVVDRLTEQNKVMREALEEVKAAGAHGTAFGNCRCCAHYCSIAQDALTAIGADVKRK